MKWLAWCLWRDCNAEAGGEQHPSLPYIHRITFISQKMIHVSPTGIAVCLMPRGFCQCFVTCQYLPAAEIPRHCKNATGSTIRVNFTSSGDCVLSGLWNLEINMQACNQPWDFSVPGCNEEQRFLCFILMWFLEEVMVIPRGAEISLALEDRAVLGLCLCCSGAGWGVWDGRRWMWSCKRWVLGSRDGGTALIAVPWCCFMAIWTQCGWGHLDDTLDWDKGGALTLAHLVAVPEFL